MKINQHLMWEVLLCMRSKWEKVGYAGDRWYGTFDAFITFAVQHSSDAIFGLWETSMSLS